MVDKTALAAHHLLFLIFGHSTFKRDFRLLSRNLSFAKLRPLTYLIGYSHVTLGCLILN